MARKPKPGPWYVSAVLVSQPVGYMDPAWIVDVSRMNDHVIEKKTFTDRPVAPALLMGAFAERYPVEVTPDGQVWWEDERLL